jgi:mono/diheme cytochrome c family protein
VDLKATKAIVREKARQKLLSDHKGESDMKCKFAAAATLLLMALSTWGWAQDDGAATYKAKCASCHGASGEGKGKNPALKGVAADTIVQQVTKGKPDSKAPHKKPISGVSEAQAKALAEFIQSLK